MQHVVIMAFRKRLKKRGYAEISIKRVEMSDKQNYIVRAVEPLSKTVVTCEYSLIGMSHMFAPARDK